MEIAIQVHPHDVRDEGAQEVLNNIVGRARIQTIIAETGTLEERHPYPRGLLEHNPVHKVVKTDACLEVPQSEEWFAHLPFRPRLSAEAKAGQDYIGDLRAHAAKFQVRIVPWVKALNGAFSGEVEEVCVRSFSGNPIRTWLCPNHPLTESYVKTLIHKHLQRYPGGTILVDRLRYPDWSGATVSIERMLTCFCPRCVKLMAAEGLDPDLLRELLSTLLQNPGLLQAWMEDPQKAGVLRSWFNFRKKSISRLAGKIWGSVSQHEDYWLNLWPPSFAALLGQDYDELGRLCRGAKHFPYHKLGGGADLAAFVRSVAGDSPLRQGRVFDQLSGPLKLGRLSFEEYLKQGLPVSFVTEQTKWAKDAFAGNKIFAGIQIWDIPEQEIGEAIAAALAAKADGLFFYCYGWATLSALDQVGEWIKRH